MIHIDKPEACSGCHACSAVCPKNCIEMKVDAEGFWYPSVRQQECINCNMCEKVCPILCNKHKSGLLPKTYAAYSLDEQNRRNSSSGGVFGVISSYVLQQGGVVFGAGLNHNLDVEHCYIERIEDLNKLQGSKYVQSRIGNTFRQVKDFLETGRMVYFSGTPCQISGLKSYLEKEYTNLITQDIICHGVPSPKVWQKYIDYIKMKLGKNITDIRFRDKTYGWKSYALGLYSADKVELMQTKFQNAYILGFLSNLFLRPSCHACAFKTEARVSDITLADFWGAKQQQVCEDDDKGISLVLVHSLKGKELLEEIGSQLFLKEVPYEQAIVYNAAMTHSAVANPDRAAFFEQLDEKPIMQLLQQYTKPSLPLAIFRLCKLSGLKIRNIFRKNRESL